MAVAVNKLDTVGWSRERFEEVKTALSPFLKETGFTKVTYVPVSGLDGDNLKENPQSNHPLMKWYSGPSLVQIIGEQEKRRDHVTIDTEEAV